MKRLLSYGIVLFAIIASGYVLVNQYRPVVVATEIEVPIIEDVVRIGKYVDQTFQITGFDKIWRVISVDDETLVIEGEYLNQSGIFTYDFKSDTIVGPEDTQASSHAILELSHGVITEKEGGLEYTSASGQTSHLTDSVSKLSELRFVLSENESKILYYHPVKKRMVTYDFTKSRHKIMNFQVPENVLENFEKQVSLSPDGGYFMYEVISETQHDSYFSIFGSDSGTAYASKLKGNGPEWSAPETLKVGFYYYLDDAAKLSDVPSGDRLGYFDLKKRKVVYTAVIHLPYTPYGKIIWEGNQLIVAGRNDSVGDSGIMTYDIAGGTWEVLPVDMNGEQMRIKKRYTLEDGNYYLLEDKSELLVRTDENNHLLEVQSLGKAAEAVHHIEEGLTLYKNESGELVVVTGLRTYSFGSFDNIGIIGRLGEYIYFVASVEDGEVLFLSNE
ncbi:MULTISPECIES: hypothetical protein [unclassified Fusibacter]|uniref:hypothetical protein n=1 Tax=unclassified Fusibacter TaxID=2624464 RepID=UPI001011C650|nr:MULTISPECIES: hypothetical protein [unclassified Fusibacter]MCK8060701.1 hypothetical protein [Fusibacter sp. A2]NPE22845.1 hypothetical protein [Fusibacter sp. A1]RXV59914.1 hypothetical protein DWB64_13445 [Fusibacter sp. A1]